MARGLSAPLGHGLTDRGGTRAHPGFERSELSTESCSRIVQQQGDPPRCLEGTQNMKRILMLGAALTLVSGVAFAESPGISGVDPATPVAANDDGAAAPADFDRDGQDGKWRHGWRRGDGGHGG